MTNIHGEYTLAEVASQLNISPAWITKIRGLTNIGGELGIQGKKSNFTDKDLQELKKARILRLLEFDYKDIKNIYEAEKELLKIFPHGGKDGETLTLLIHTEEISTNYKVFMKNERAKQLWKQYTEIVGKVTERVNKTKEEMERNADELKRGSLLYEQLKKKLLGK